ncbi:MAG TPA: FAD-dependent oxidoreductase [Acidimicrobiales bacterium]|nr:FAD-dependent oxidoreductase [Acidimicrobiales bacterium]
MPAPSSTVVVGASLAGLRTVEALRRLGEDGPVTVVGAEAHPPYDRPPLSKRALTALERDPVELTALAVADDLGVEWRLGTAATGLDLERRRVVLGDDEVPFTRLVIATGASARRLPVFGEHRGVHVLRTLDDAVALRAELRTGPRVAVVGAGFIGLEVASSCRDLGLDVTVVEAARVPLELALGATIGARVAGRHRDAGVRLETGVAVADVIGTGRVEALELGDGRRIAADVVVVGIGVAPATSWLDGSGVDLDDGVRCDSRLRVLRGGRPMPEVVAAGDVARWQHPVTGRPVRVEHWTNAVEQGDAAARTLLGGDAAPPFAPVPYFWSDQLGAKLQMLGTTDPGDEVAVLDDDGTGSRWLAAYGRDGRTVAAVGSSRAAKLMRLRPAIEQGSPFPPPLP